MMTHALSGLQKYTRGSWMGMVYVVDFCEMGRTKVRFDFFSGYVLCTPCRDGSKCHMGRLIDVIVPTFQAQIVAVMADVASTYTSELVDSSTQF